MAGRQAAAQALAPDIFPNFAGLGAGVAPDWSGSKDMMFGAVPGLRWRFSGERYVGVYGPFVEANLLDNPNFQFGPVLNLRLGREDVDDPVVRLLPEVGTTVEGGAMIGFTYTHSGTVPFRARLGLAVVGDLGGHYGGLSALPFASLWVPLSPTVFIGVGAGGRLSSRDFNDTYYGVSAEGSAASGLAPYNPKSGLNSWTAWPSLLWRVSEHWAVGAGMIYSRLSGAAADSPIVRDRGSRDQFIGGIGIAYLW